MMTKKCGIEIADEALVQSSQQNVLTLAGLPRRQSTHANLFIKSIHCKQHGFFEQHHPFYPGDPSVGAGDGVGYRRISAVDIMTCLVSGPPCENVSMRGGDQLD